MTVVTWPVSPAEIRQFPMSPTDTAGEICARISSPALARPPLLTQGVDLDKCMYYTAVQNPIYGCEHIPQTTFESSNTPLIFLLNY